MIARDQNSTVAVAGGGLIGMSVAWRLAQRGFSVVVLEKGIIGGEASWAGAGMLAPGGEVESSSPLADLALESRALYQSFVRDLEECSGLAIDYQECGAVDLAYSQTEWDELRERSIRQLDLGIHSKPVTPEQIATFWPRVRLDNLAGGLFYPRDALVDPRELITALAAACHSLGVSVEQNCAVTRVDVKPDGIRIETTKGSRSSGAAVIAAGAWSSTIPVNGVPGIPAVHPVKGHLIGYQQPTQTCNTILRHGHRYLLQRANGLLIVGASMEDVGFDRTVQPAIADSLTSEARFILPHLAETEPTAVWTGFRPASESPLMQPWHSNRLFLAYGHYRNGILLAPVTAERMAREVTANWGMR